MRFEFDSYNKNWLTSITTLSDEHFPRSLPHCPLHLPPLQPTALQTAPMLFWLKASPRSAISVVRSSCQPFHINSHQTWVHTTGRAILSLWRCHFIRHDRSQNCWKHHQESSHHHWNHLSDHAGTLRTQQLQRRSWTKNISRGQEIHWGPVQEESFEQMNLKKRKRKSEWN